MARTIRLTQGKSTIVDDEDYERLMQWKWHVTHNGSMWYAKRNTYDKKSGKVGTVYMHRVIIGAKKGELVDHRDADSLNNTKENLRIATRQQNVRNRRGSYNVTSTYKGVDWYAAYSKWRARIKFNGKQIFLGFFLDEIEAARAYDKAAEEYHGEFARLNFQEGCE